MKSQKQLKYIKWSSYRLVSNKSETAKLKVYKISDTMNDADRAYVLIYWHKSKISSNSATNKNKNNQKMASHNNNAKVETTTSTAGMN